MLIWCLLGIVLLIVSLNDFLFFRIEDENIIALLGLYGISCIFGVSGNNFFVGFCTASVVFLITLVLNHFYMIGGGDVKLLFPLILFAENNLNIFLIGVSISGIILAIIYIILGQYIFEIRRNIIFSLLKLRKKHKKNALLNIALLSLSKISNRTTMLKNKNINVWKQEIPYGIALAGGEMCVIFENLLCR